jgi:DNA helicase HerA-like ATPase
LVEQLSAAGVPVFLADVKGDLAGLAQPGGGQRVQERAAELGIEIQPRGFPVEFWDLYGEQGHPVRTTVSEMGPLLLARLLELNETQEGVLHVVFKVADEQGLLLLNLEDLRAMLTWVAENAKALRTEYGNVSAASVGAVQRQLLVLGEQGGDRFFGEPALELASLMRAAPDGRGIVNILAADRLVQSPRVYGTFLLWLLAELFEELPERGDVDRPDLVLFFDEAHLLFDDAPRELLDKIEQVVRLIRSKGVGVYFITQSPGDLPDTVLAQLGNRVQHALRAFTPSDQKRVRTAADTFRPNPAFKTLDVITTLRVGEALVSVLDEQGSPSTTQRALIQPPVSRLGPLTPEERRAVVQASPFAGQFDRTIDRESACELLRERRERVAAEAAQEEMSREAARAPRAPARSSRREDPLEAFAKSTLRSAGRQLGAQLVRGLLGALTRR